MSTAIHSCVERPTIALAARPDQAIVQLLLQRH